MYLFRFLEHCLSHIEVFSISNTDETHPTQKAVRSLESKSKRGLLVSRYMDGMWPYTLHLPIPSNPTFSPAKGRDIDPVHAGMV
jgi:hypothetical protein